MEERFMKIGWKQQKIWEIKKLFCFGSLFNLKRDIV